jgi:hypothetical protein
LNNPSRGDGRVLGGDSQPGQRGTFGGAASLFPVAERVHTDARKPMAESGNDLVWLVTGARVRSQFSGVFPS